MDNKFCFSFFVFFAIFFPGIFSQHKTSDSCAGVIDQVTCHHNNVRFAYNAPSLECERLINKGCGKSENNFFTLKGCQATCEGICFQERKRGSCGSSISVFGFDAKARKCVQYNYGGCNGTGNRFSSESNCRNVCGKLYS